MKLNLYLFHDSATLQIRSEIDYFPYLRIKVQVFPYSDQMEEILSHNHYRYIPEK